MKEKIRPNALYLGTVAAILAGISILLIYETGALKLEQLALVLVVGAAACVGGLLTLAGQCATDPEPNPAIEVTRLLIPVITAAVTQAVQATVDASEHVVDAFTDEDVD